MTTEPATALDTSETFTDACILEAEVITTGPMGGDAGHGGRTVLKLTTDGGDTISVGVRRAPGDTYSFDPAEDPYSFMIVAEGDAEARVLVNALEWAAKQLRTQFPADES
jgi:hypothetical protein